MMRSAVLSLVLLLACGPAFAQMPATGNSDQPIEITATKTVEWLREKKQYVARENVIVTQGKMTLRADLLTADYTEGASSSMEITRLTAEGHVQISDGENTAHGDRSVYDVPTGVAVLTGQDLKITSPDQTVTAKDRMEYHANERFAKAIGQAKVVRGEDTMTADTITAFMKQDGAAKTAPKPAAAAGEKKGLAGTGSLDRLEADGHVVIKTPAEQISGRKAVYRAAANTAEMTGGVKISRDKNTLEGERAEVNLTTNVSKMFGSTKDGGRVRGVFFPGKSMVPSPSKTPDGQAAAPVTAAPPSTAPAAAVSSPQSPASIAAEPGVKQ